MMPDVQIVRHTQPASSRAQTSASGIVHEVSKRVGQGGRQLTEQGAEYLMRLPQELPG